jgi:hypothetical protein
MKLGTMSLIGMLGVGFTQMAFAEINGLPRSLTCNAYPTGIVASLDLKILENDRAILAGNVVDNFNDASFSDCRLDRDKILCAGKWRHRGESASLEISQSSDGTYKGHLLRSSGRKAILGCLLSWDPLPSGECQ